MPWWDAPQPVLEHTAAFIGSQKNRNNSEVDNNGFLKVLVTSVSLTWPAMHTFQVILCFIFFSFTTVLHTCQASEPTSEYAKGL